jgi:molecular chaperone GrpE (heat shock protein)
LTEALESCPPLPPFETEDPNQKEDILVTEHRNLHEGLGMVQHILLRTLERHGLTVIPADGEVDPLFHEVVREIATESKEPGSIASVIKRGYMLNGKVLRQTKVAVAGKPKMVDNKS